MTMLAHFDGLPKDLFIETGTHIGNTLAHASRYFDRCISIEQNEKLYAAAVDKFAKVKNVELFRGHSPHVLRDILITRNVDPRTPTTFWLDAHYSADGTTLCPDGGECPLIRELEVIVKTDWATPPVIMIDDAFMFDDTVPHPGSKYPFWFSNESDHIVYHRSQWPRVEEIDEVLLGWKRSMLANENAFRYDWNKP